MHVQREAPRASAPPAVRVDVPPFVPAAGLPADFGTYSTWFFQQLQQDPALRPAVVALHGRPLTCGCGRSDCHAILLATYAEAAARPRDGDGWASGTAPRPTPYATPGPTFTERKVRDLLAGRG